jgi:hypothetical protein
MDIPNQNGGFNYSPMMSSSMMMPIFGPTQQVPAPQSPTINMGPGFVPVPIFNMQGPTIPQYPNSPPSQNNDMAAYQQNLQRAFLQSAMAQNIQIQQQLLAQNQALQQLLVQSPNSTQPVRLLQIISHFVYHLPCCTCVRVCVCVRVCACVKGGEGWWSECSNQLIRRMILPILLSSIAN